MSLHRVVGFLMLTLLQRGVTHAWSFSGLATIVRIMLMYYIDVICFHLFLLVGKLLDNLTRVDDREGDDMVPAGSVKWKCEYKLLAVLKYLNLPLTTPFLE